MEKYREKADFFMMYIVLEKSMTQFLVFLGWVLEVKVVFNNCDVVKAMYSEVVTRI